MREILFRGKAINREDGFNYRSNYKNGDWVYGLITKKYNEKYDLAAEMTNEIGISGIEVDYKTIGQFTGLTDKNGVKIFEGDIIKSSLAGLNYEVFWDGAFAAYTMIDTRDRYGFPRYGLPRYGARTYEVISNIYDNPELIEGGDTDG